MKLPLMEPALRFSMRASTTLGKIGPVESGGPLHHPLHLDAFVLAPKYHDLVYPLHDTFIQLGEHELDQTNWR